MTEKIFYENAYQKDFEATVISCEKKKDKWLVVLDKTCFYPEGGGQPADHGMLGCAKVLDVHEKGEDIFHTTDIELAPGTRVKGEIDWERRFDHMQQHSGEHIISGMLCRRFNCSNIGFHLGSEIIQIDYNADITWEEVLETEALANRYIWENHNINVFWPDKETLCTLEYRSKKELSGAVRITEWPGADMCACCGTHVNTSSEVGLVKALSLQKIKDGVRIEIMSGKRAFDYLSGIWENNQEISKELSSKPTETADAVTKLKTENYKLRYECNAYVIKHMEGIAEKYQGVSNPVVFVENLGGENTRRLCDMISSTAFGRCCVFAGEDGAYNYAVINKGTDIKAFISAMNAALGGKGGGKNGFAQGNLTSNRAQIMEFLTKMTNE